MSSGARQNAVFATRWCRKTEPSAWRACSARRATVPVVTITQTTSCGTGSWPGRWVSKTQTPEPAPPVAKKEEIISAPAPSTSSSASTIGDLSGLITKVESLEKIMLRIEDRLIKIEEELFK
jgi:hypothetical protein